MTIEVFEKLLSPSTMLDGEQSLLGMKSEAIPLLRDLLDGTAKNANGVAYRNLGLPLHCALEVASRLGPEARPLEGLLVKELHAGKAVAATALGQAGETTVEALAISLDPPAAARFELELPYEAGLALMRLGASEHPSVLRSIEASKSAKANWTKVREWAARRSGIASG
ncbi:hypothetical protein [Dyella flagellata]|uniref:Uncharacterized protein n=1 Tax=Dyella flagellata TaxID=1867833 RepID=A0ABQ5XAD1_9GAMM|nr:hypothetical protein [Dyella flagellata]GLQ87857.1 hypothetical protein GCM10007898_14250 [Dyella flagellata]